MKVIECFKKSILVQIVGIAAVVFVVFLPSLFAEFSKVDDVEMLSRLGTVTRFDLRSVFIPQAGNGLYYRPIIHLSFLLDLFVFKLNPLWMHLHNVLIHIANSFLVYLVFRYFTVKQTNTSLLPVTAALLFGVHPLATESVNWISGRTDLLSSFFILCATLLLLKYKDHYSKRDGYLALVLILLAVLTKEFALAFLPGAVLLMTKPQHPDGDCKQHHNIYRTVLACLFIIIVIIASFYLLRSIAFTSNSSRIGLTLQIMFTDLSRTITVFAGTFAFYIKKIFYPFPLNFAIVQIDPVYELLAIPLIVICFRALYARTVSSIMFLTGIFLLSPAFLISLNQIAWTPYAERYAYLSAAFCLIGTVSYVSNRFHGRFIIQRVVITSLLILVAGGATMARNITWQTNFALMEDTTSKSPYAVESRLLYGSLLAERGEHSHALTELEEGKHLPGLGYDARFDINISSIYASQHKFDISIEKLEEGLVRSKGRSTTILNELIKMLEQKTVRVKNLDDRESIFRRIIKLRLDLYRLTNDASQLLAIKDIALRIEDDELFKRYSKLTYQERK